MLVDVLVLVMLVDLELHLRNLGQHVCSQSGVDHHVDAVHRVHAQHHFVQLHLHTLGGDPLDLRRHLLDGLENAIVQRETKLRDEPGCAQHPQRIVVERVLRRRRRIEFPGQQGVHAVQRIDKRVGTVRADLHRHRVDGEIAAHQIVGQRRSVLDYRITRDTVVSVGPEGRDLDLLAVLDGADGPELDAGVPLLVHPALEQSLNLLRPGVRREVQIATEAAQDRVANTATHQEQLVTGLGKTLTERVQHVGQRAERCSGVGKQS